MRLFYRSDASSPLSPPVSPPFSAKYSVWLFVNVLISGDGETLLGVFPPPPVLPVNFPVNRTWFIRDILIRANILGVAIQGSEISGAVNAGKLLIKCVVGWKGWS